MADESYIIRFEQEGERVPGKSGRPSIKTYAVIRCQGCGEEFRILRHFTNGYASGRKPQRFCSSQCWGESLRRGGTVTPSGYRVHSVASRDVIEHRAVMERIIGRKLLRTETVHHKNGNRLDNRPGNLELWDGRQPGGQRAEDKAAYAKEILRDYVPNITASEYLCGMAALI